MLVEPLHIREVALEVPQDPSSGLRLPVEVPGTKIVVATIPKGTVIEDDLIFQVELPPSCEVALAFVDRGATVDVVVTIVPE